VVVLVELLFHRELTTMALMERIQFLVMRQMLLLLLVAGAAAQKVKTD